MEEERINARFIDDAECPSLKDCPSCPNLRHCEKEITERFVKIPDYVASKFKDLPSSAVEVFLFINRKANFMTFHKDFGTCRLSYSKIIEATGLTENTINKSIKLLKERRLIAYETERHHTNAKWKTGHIFHVLWFFIDKALKERPPQ